MATNDPWAPPLDAQSSLVPSQSSLTFDGGHIPSPNVPQAYPWYYPPTPQLLNYAEYQVPSLPVEVPQVHPQSCTQSSQLLGYAEAQVPMPPPCAPHGSSYFPCHVPAFYTPSLQPIGYAGGQVPMPPLGAPQGYPPSCAPSLQSPGYAENQVLMPPFDAPQSYPQFRTSSLQSLGYAEGQAPMPPSAAPQIYPQLCPPYSQLDGAEDQALVPRLDAPQYSHSPSPAGQSIENSASACGHSFPMQERKSTDPLPLAPQNNQVTKRKRKVSLSADNDDKQQDPAAPAQAVIPAEPSTRKRKKADYDPQECPYCHKLTSRPRRSRMHVRDICLKKRIFKNELSDIAIGQEIKQWGIPQYFLRNSIPILDVKAKYLKKHFQKLRGRLDELIRGTSDENVVDVLINEGGLTSLSRITLETNTSEESTSQAKSSRTRSVRGAGARGSEVAIENSKSTEYRMPTPCLSETYETSSNFPCPPYFSRTTPPANSVGMTSSGAKAQAPLDSTVPFLFGQGATVPFSFGQNEIRATGLQSDLVSGAIPPPQYESGAIGWSYNFIPPITYPSHAHTPA
ncbi:hypothetical protein C0993_012028 [Termitomyces sp. T159_Od127]|nr:hypothetical protein C0993_012028 [Termitomyces sp. T159_Od127]